MSSIRLTQLLNKLLGREPPVRCWICHRTIEEANEEFTKMVLHRYPEYNKWYKKGEQELIGVGNVEVAIKKLQNIGNEWAYRGSPNNTYSNHNSIALPPKLQTKFFLENPHIDMKDCSTLIRNIATSNNVTEDIAFELANTRMEKECDTIVDFMVKNRLIRWGGQYNVTYDELSEWNYSFKTNDDWIPYKPITKDNNIDSTIEAHNEMTKEKII